MASEPQSTGASPGAQATGGLELGGPTPVPAGPLLVTGGAGFVGSHAVRVLHRARVPVAVLDNLSEGHRDAVPREVPLFEGDLLDPGRLDEVLEAVRPRSILHFAALCYVGDSVKEPERYHRVNVGGTRNLVEAARRAGVQEFVFSSTCATYGVPEVLPLAEDHPQRPISPYGETKLLAEGVLHEAAAEWGLRIACLRYFNAAGADPSGAHGEDHRPETHLIPLVLQVALGQRERILVFGDDHGTRDGTCERDYVHVDDLADAHLRALHLLQGGVERIACNLGTGTGHTVREVVEAARRVTGHAIPAEAAPRREGDPAGLVADGRHARATLGWTPRRSSLEQILGDAWAWHSARPGGYGEG